MLEHKTKKTSGGETPRGVKRKRILIAITASVLVALSVGLIVAETLITKLSGQEQVAQDPPDYIPEIGESYYGSTILAYPSFTQSAVDGVVVGSHKGNYAMYRSESGGYFFFCYEGEDGEMQVYYPDIVGAESNFDYTSLYSVESADGLNVYKITYLLAALGTLTVDQRIELSDDDLVRTQQLNRYGLNANEAETIFIVGKDAKGNEIRHSIEIGDTLLAGTGYYYRVDNRDYIYTSNGTYLSYALEGFEGFISPNLVAEGLPEDGVYEPYYTTGYSQWKNKVTKYDEELSAELQALVKENSRVVAQVRRATPIKDDKYYEEQGINKNSSNGYAVTDRFSTEFDLQMLAILPQYGRLIDFFTSHRLGDYSEDELLLTVVSDTLEIEFGDADSVSYEYRITNIESVLTDTAEYGADDGYTKVADVEGATMIKVAYDYYIGGEKQNEVMRHAVIKLAELDADTQAAVADSEIGKAADISFSVDYSKDTAKQYGVTYVISEIAIILEGDSLAYGETVTENSTVTFRYYLKANGNKVVEEESATVRIADLKEGNYLKLKEALLGKSIGKNQNIEAYTNVMYTQLLSDFITYSVEGISCFVESELISSFEFVNPSERDAFHGNAVYKNTLPVSNKYANYALNATACSTVIGLLGGIGLDSSSDHSEGLAGVETVALGITPEKMEKYGLYANTVYFELPRTLFYIKNDDPDVLEDVSYFGTLGFTLYISDYDHEEGCRYIASDMYDVIAKVEDRGFDYLDLSFADFFATRNVVLVSYQNIDKVTLDFYLEDYKGSYVFDATCETVYIADGEIHLSRPEGVDSTKQETLTVDITANGDLSSIDPSQRNKLIEYLIASGKDTMSMTDLYNKVASEELGYEVDLSSGTSSLGVASFQDMLLLMFNTYYLGTLTPEEQEAGLKTEKLMSFSFTVEGSARDTYTYDFYRVDDRRVMVSLYNPGYDNEVCDFYITTFAFKKMIYNFDRLLNGQEIDLEAYYG